MRRELLVLLALAAGCGPGPGEFECGDVYCQLASEYCETTPTNVGLILDLPPGVGGDEIQCRPLPDACSGARDCACLSAETCGQRCLGNGEVGLTLHCPTD